MSNSAKPHIREALNNLSDATCRLADSLLGQEPSEHLKKSMHHAIMAATKSIDQLNERMHTCRSQSLCGTRRKPVKLP